MVLNGEWIKTYQESNFLGGREIFLIGRGVHCIYIALIGSYFSQRTFHYSCLYVEQYAQLPDTKHRVAMGMKPAPASATLHMYLHVHCLKVDYMYLDCLTCISFPSTSDTGFGNIQGKISWSIHTQRISAETKLHVTYFSSPNEIYRFKNLPTARLWGEGEYSTSISALRWPSTKLYCLLESMDLHYNASQHRCMVLERDLLEEYLTLMIVICIILELARLDPWLLVLTVCVLGTCLCEGGWLLEGWRMIEMKVVCRVVCRVVCMLDSCAPGINKIVPLMIGPSLPYLARCLPNPNGATIPFVHNRWQFCDVNIYHSKFEDWSNLSYMFRVDVASLISNILI